MSFRKLKIGLFAIYSHFKFVNKLLIPVQGKNSIQVTLLLKFILMCQFYALSILSFGHNIPMQLAKHILRITPWKKETWNFSKEHNVVFWNGFNLHWDKIKKNKTKENHISHAERKKSCKVISSWMKYSS